MKSVRKTSLSEPEPDRREEFRNLPPALLMKAKASMAPMPYAPNFSKYLDRLETNLASVSTNPFAILKGYMRYQYYDESLGGLKTLRILKQESEASRREWGKKCVDNTGQLEIRVDTYLIFDKRNPERQKGLYSVFFNNGNLPEDVSIESLSFEQQIGFEQPIGFFYYGLTNLVPPYDRPFRPPMILSAVCEPSSVNAPGKVDYSAPIRQDSLLEIPFP